MWIEILINHASLKIQKGVSATVCYSQTDLWLETMLKIECSLIFFFKYLCSKRVFYLCRKISQGSFRQRHRDKGFWLLLLLEYKLVLPLLCNELLGRDVSGTLDGMWRVNVQKWQSGISHANVQSGRDNLLRTFKFFKRYEYFTFSVFCF